MINADTFYLSIFLQTKLGPMAMGCHFLLDEYKFGILYFDKNRHGQDISFM